MEGGIFLKELPVVFKPLTSLLIYMFQTKEEAEKVAQSFSRFSRLTSSGLDPDQLRMTYSRGHGQKKTSTGDGVLNRSRALEWELRTAPRDPPYIKRK